METSEELKLFEQLVIKVYHGNVVDPKVDIKCELNFCAMCLPREFVGTFMLCFSTTFYCCMH